MKVLTFCRSGRHRSVALALLLQGALQAKGHHVTVRHLCQDWWQQVWCQRQAWRSLLLMILVCVQKLNFGSVLFKRFRRFVPHPTHMRRILQGGVCKECFEPSRVKTEMLDAAAETMWARSENDVVGRRVCFLQCLSLQTANQLTGSKEGTRRARVRRDACSKWLPPVCDDRALFFAWIPNLGPKSVFVTHCFFFILSLVHFAGHYCDHHHSAVRQAAGASQEQEMQRLALLVSR